MSASLCFAACSCTPVLLHCGPWKRQIGSLVYTTAKFEERVQMLRKKTREKQATQLVESFQQFRLKLSSELSSNVRHITRAFCGRRIQVPWKNHPEGFVQHAQHETAVRTRIFQWEKICLATVFFKRRQRLAEIDDDNLLKVVGESRCQLASALKHILKIVSITPSIGSHVRNALHRSCITNTDDITTARKLGYLQCGLTGGSASCGIATIR
eukprot:gb/GECG01001180.1/.p1 GENE.gb/GECG01001180.1/~~gb/GECG01001180.1/.p1  ORF type:complete len:212 (+),score=13.86 gb/GECG01001180.1/:1-636(+)